MKYSEKTLRKKALEAGYKVSKGFQHFTNVEGNPVRTNYKGERFTGYDVVDLRTGFSVWDSYNNCFDHLWTLEDVENFLKEEYERYGLEF